MKEKHTHTHKKNKDGKEQGVRAKLLCCAFKLGFLQLICKGSLFFRWNLELALSIIL